MNIQILSDQVASQIAAGEVVERPASVVKELIENAIDAGASTINIDIRNGGRQLIQVADDGSGIQPQEIETAFLRHATSKLTSVDDLQAIRSLGFRGEALASIAAVSHLTVVSRAGDQSVGTRLILEGGYKSGRETVGAPQGTVIAVTNIFYNVPARLNFLKSVATEKRVMDEYVTRYAIAYPTIRFRLTHDNRITFQSSGNGSLIDVLAAVYGPDMAGQLLSLGTGENALDSIAENQISEVSVSGFVTPPTLHWSNRGRITLFVNGRWIRNNQLTYAVIQAYHTLLPAGRYPMAVLFLAVPAESVDVNVHPTKTEIRFKKANKAFSTVQRAVRQAVMAESPVRQATHFSSFQASGWSGSLDQPAFSRREEPLPQAALDLDWTIDERGTVDGDTQASQNALAKLGGERLPIMRVVGQVGASYIITEGPEGLYLIDQHAAHERVLYEKFMAAWEAANGQETMAAQGLVNGTVVHLSPSQSSILSDQLEFLTSIGFEVESFGPSAYMIRSVPAMLTGIDPSKALIDVVEDLERGDTPLEKTIEDRIILRVCKSAAVKAGQTLDRQEMEAMIRQLENCRNPHTCPHGRPTLIHLSVSQLAKEFGRT